MRKYGTEVFAALITITFAVPPNYRYSFPVRVSAVMLAFLAIIDFDRDKWEAETYRYVLSGVSTTLASSLALFWHVQSIQTIYSIIGVTMSPVRISISVASTGLLAFLCGWAFQLKRHPQALEVMRDKLYEMGGKEPSTIQLFGASSKYFMQTENLATNPYLVSIFNIDTLQARLAEYQSPPQITDDMTVREVQSRYGERGMNAVISMLATLTWTFRHLFIVSILSWVFSVPIWLSVILLLAASLPELTLVAIEADFRDVSVRQEYSRFRASHYVWLCLFAHILIV